MKKYALIIEGYYCGKTHIHNFYDTMYEAILGARDFIDKEWGFDSNKGKEALNDFAENDFEYLDDVFIIDEIEVD